MNILMALLIGTAVMLVPISFAYVLAGALTGNKASQVVLVLLLIFLLILLGEGLCETNQWSWCIL